MQQSFSLVLPCWNVLSGQLIHLNPKTFLQPLLLMSWSPPVSHAGTTGHMGCTFPSTSIQMHSQTLVSAQAGRGGWFENAQSLLLQPLRKGALARRCHMAAEQWEPQEWAAHNLEKQLQAEWQSKSEDALVQNQTKVCHWFCPSSLYSNKKQFVWESSINPVWTHCFLKSSKADLHGQCGEFSNRHLWRNCSVLLSALLNSRTRVQALHCTQLWAVLLVLSLPALQYTISVCMMSLWDGWRTLQKLILPV